MRRLLASALFAAGAWPQQGAGPGELASSGPLSVAMDLAGKLGVTLPPQAAYARTIQCAYHPARPGAAQEIRHFWSERSPSWLATVPAGHPIHKLVGRLVTRCPATLAEADLTQDQLGAMRQPPGAERLMGTHEKQTVFAIPLDARNLIGKWTEVAPISRDGKKAAKPGETVRWLLTGTELVELGAGTLSVMPVTFSAKDGTFCYDDPEAGKKRCAGIANFNEELTLIDIVHPASFAFEVTRHLTVLEAGSPAMPGPRELADAKLRTARTVEKRKEETRLNKEGLSKDGFLVRGMQNAELAMKIHDGAFGAIAAKPRDLVFYTMLNRYIESFAVRCTAFLPPNKVQMTKDVCVASEERYWVNGLGIRTYAGSSCLRYETVNRGVFADPDLYAAQKALGLGAGLQMLGSVTGAGGDLNGIFEPVRLAQAATSDMDLLFENNACNSPGLRRFQENLLRFARGSDPVILSDKDALPAAELASKAESVTAADGTDFKQLLEDLIAINSRSWFFNRFVPGSVNGAVVTRRDAAGQPLKLVAQYLYNGNQKGSVTVEFQGGAPACLYFFDRPDLCRPPDAAVARKYKDGGYR